MGALEYRPETVLEGENGTLDFDELAAACQKIFEDRQSEDLDSIYHLGGSSGGARPKANIQWEDEPWIVKFPCSFDSKDVGEMEYAYHVCARACGVIVPEVRLFPSKNHKGYFGTKRFDRQNGEKVHMVSAGALLETSHRLLNLDCEVLMKLTRFLTQSEAECWRLFDLMCFNVFAHNHDDHAKNFSFLFEEGTWRLSPAYDLTYSNALGGEHSTTIHGKGKDPDMEDFLAVARTRIFQNTSC
ncbi:type II toxin-antitoxin system HipA family toxin [uncultured Dubosiella sp.]|uniref:type II toxin-antitoxin system HipA family toxin n=1 Tax=uncultured Dubosiella sp. TaxID=1937011 RepID=UPI00272F8D29|nr:HipA domain-containing protein [uncultured Dubosiella sp.]